MEKFCCFQIPEHRNVGVISSRTDLNLVHIEMDVTQSSNTRGETLEDIHVGLLGVFVYLKYSPRVFEASSIL